MNKEAKSFFGFSDRQEYFYDNSVKPINIAHGPIHCAKTDVEIVRWFFEFLARPGEHLIIGKTQETTIRNIFEGTRKLKYWWPLKISNSNVLQISDSKAWIYGADNKNAESKIRGGNFKTALVDELTLIPQGLISHLIGRAEIIFAACNADSPYHYIYTDFINNNNQDVFECPFQLRDNPSLTQEYIERLSRQYTGIWKQRFIDGLWTMAEGIIYTAYNPVMHEYEYKIRYDQCDGVLIGIDYGTQFPTAFEEILKQGERYYNQRELYLDPKKTGKILTDSELADQFDLFVQGIPPNVPLFIYCDETSHSLMAELRKRRYSIIPASVHNPRDRVGFVNSLYHQNRLFIHKSCTMVRQQNTIYRWDETAQKHGEDKPMKQDDHAENALEYPLYMDAKTPKINQIR